MPERSLTMKVFISQKMRGWKPEEILKVREEVEALIRRNHGDNVEIIGSMLIKKDWIHDGDNR